MNNFHLSIVKISFLVIILSACRGGASDQAATAQALNESFSQTSTSAASEAFSAKDNLATVQAQATQNSLDIAATQSVADQLSAEAQSATATAVAPFIADLSSYGIDPSSGYMAWIHPPVTLDIQGYLQYDYANDFIGTTATDFVVSADITWDTSYGTSGCGFVLRSDGNEDALNQYLAIATRGGNGRVIFSSMVDGEVENVVDNYAYGKDPLFDWQNGTTNRITVVARGEIFSIYTNGTKVGEVAAGKPPVLVLPLPPVAPPDGSTNDAQEEFEAELQEYNDLVDQMKIRHQQNIAIYQPDTPYFERGFVALVGLSESGRTICQFDNTWLWIMDE